jgi:rubredoxin
MVNTDHNYKKWQCVACEYVYDEELGDEEENLPPGTRFEDIPDDWYCPDCGATKAMFIELED